MSRRSIFWALRLDLAAWRKRNGAEFAALLEEVGPGFRRWWDVARGGLKGLAAGLTAGVAATARRRPRAMTARAACGL